jgi:hypothetical protein
VIVLLVWGAAAVLAAILLGIVGYELVGHLRRLFAALGAAERDLGPRVRHLADALATAGTAARTAGGTAGGRGGAAPGGAAAGGATAGDPGGGTAGTGSSAGGGRDSTPGAPGRHRADP